MFFSEIFNLQNWDLLTIGVAIAAILILSFVAYFSNPKSISNKSFLLFAFLTAIYGIFNYINYKVTSPFLILWFLRLTIFSALWHAFSLFQFFYVFPAEKIVFPKKYTHILLPVVVCISLITLTPLVFSHISQVATSAGQVTNPERGPGIALFGIMASFLVIGGIYNLFRKTLQANNEARQQFNFILLGTILSFSLVIIFNLFLPLVFNILTFIPLAPVFMLPFIIFTAYSVMKYHLFNTKIIATELLTFLLAIGLLFEILLSDSGVVAIFRFLIFLLVLTIGVLLIKSVRKEVKQREQLEILDKELGEANEKLKSLDLARAEFISIASHQLRTPPATVKWYLSSIIDGDYGKLTKKVTEQLKKTQTTNNHLISLIEDMLNVSRIERGKMEFLFTPTNVEELARFAYEQLIPMASDKQLDLVYEPPKTALPEIMADKEKLRQVMNNLIDNAIKYTKTGKVTVLLKKSDTDILFKVTDSGKGISETDKSAIFQKYTRGKESIKQSAGLGLGLYVAKIIIDQHKGKIWAESPGEGKGSSFCFTIPINNGLKETTLVDLSKNQPTKK